jgi:hypothetical protein
MWAERRPKSSSDSSSTSPPDRPPLSAPKMVIGLCVLTLGLLLTLDNLRLVDTSWLLHY